MAKRLMQVAKAEGVQVNEVKASCLISLLLSHFLKFVISINCMHLDGNKLL